MGDLDSVEAQLGLAKTLARELPRPAASAPAVDLPVAGAATRALRWLGEEARQVRVNAEADDLDGFLASFEQLGNRARALEPVVAQLRPRWGDASVHVRMFQWCREVAFTVWAAACPQQLRVATASRSGGLPALDTASIRSGWAAVRAALAAMEPVNPDDFHEPMEEELAAIRGTAAPQRVVARDRIPQEHQSRAMGKGEAAKLHAGFLVPDAAVYFDELIAKKIVTAPIGSGRQWRFDVREFPASKREQMR
ncbi:MAG: hypothetical protein H0T51_05495 [Pirellulales bacterium]|nr:hypothetical protein [Pirellulales bacterium]